VTGVCAWRACGSRDRTLFSLPLGSLSLHALESCEPVSVDQVLPRPSIGFAVIGNRWRRRREKLTIFKVDHF